MIEAVMFAFSKRKEEGRVALGDKHCQAELRTDNLPTRLATIQSLGPSTGEAVGAAILIMATRRETFDKR